MKINSTDLHAAQKIAEQVSQFEEKRAELLLKAAENESKLRKRIKIDSLIAVHLTDFFPDNGIVLTTGQVDLNRGGIKTYFPRETIHFALNGPVGSHMYASWEGKKYAILIPLRSIYERVFALRPEDTFIIGNLTLPRDAEILGKPQDLKNKNPGYAKMIPFQENEDAHAATNRRIGEKGYVKAKVEMWGWSFEDEALAMREIGSGGAKLHNYDFGELMQKEGKDSRTHQDGLFGKVELHLKEADSLMSRDYSKIYYPDNMIENCNKIVEELIALKNKLSHRPTRHLQEEVALERLINFMQRLPEEYRFMGVISSLVNEIVKLSKDEKKWLTKEYILSEKLKEKISKGKVNAAKSVLRKLAQRERRVFKLYTALNEKIVKIKEDPSLNYVLQNVDRTIQALEAKLVRVLSGQSDELSTLLESGKIKEAVNMINLIEKDINGLVLSLTTIDRVLSSRLKYFK